MAEPNSIVQSYNEEMLDQEMQLKKQISFDRVINTNVLKLNALLCVIIFAINTYFIIGHNYILTWTPDSEKSPGKEFQIGIKSFRVNGFATFYGCLDFKQNCLVSESKWCRSIDIPLPVDFHEECEGLRDIYPIGIIFIVCIAFGTFINIITLISIFSLLKEKDELPDIGVSISKFEVMFYLFSSVEYLIHCLFLKGSFSYRYPIVIIYSVTIISLANIISFRLAFYRYIRIKTRANLLCSI